MEDYDGKVEEVELRCGVGGRMNELRRKRAAVPKGISERRSSGSKL